VRFVASAQRSGSKDVVKCLDTRLFRTDNELNSSHSALTRSNVAVLCSHTTQCTQVLPCVCDLLIPFICH
jgi:hypothetical protein